MSQSDENKLPEVLDGIPAEVVESIYTLSTEGAPYAAFDLDKTLLINDIGEVVLAGLIKNKLITNFTFNDYLALIEKNPGEAYKKTIEVMNGMEAEKLIKITHEIIDSKDSFIEVEGLKIPITSPHPVMLVLLAMLRAKGIDVFIVTASNSISAEIICWKYFGLHPANILAAKINVNHKGIISTEGSEIPYGEGKVTILKKRFHDKRPVITGGDRLSDKFLLNYTAESGIRLWRGEDEKEFEQLKENDFKNVKFYHITR